MQAFDFCIEVITTDLGGSPFLQSIIASNVLSEFNQEGPSANTFSVAAVIATPLVFTLDNAVAADDDNNDGDVYSGA